MKTKCFSSQPILSQEDLQEVVCLIGRGELVAIPTETVYGLAADLFQKEAIQKIFQVKGRPSDNPLIVHISAMTQLEALANHPHPLLMRLADHFWPGPLTIVFERNPQVPSTGSSSLSTIAVRMPANEIALQIIAACKTPLVAPSANISGRPSPTMVQHVLDDFDGTVSAVVDGGSCEVGIESTVVGWIEDELVLLRPGKISREEIAQVAKEPIKNPRKHKEIHSPGMKYRHYAPRATITFVENRKEAMCRSKSVYVPEKLSMHNLYMHLREADRLGYSEIVICLDAEIRSQEALMNRLLRASGMHD